MLDELFSNYIKLTESILSGVKNDISVDEFFDKREEVIKTIADLDVSKSEKKKVYESSGAESLDKMVVQFIKDEMKSTKEEMQKAIANKKVYSSYVSNNVSGSFFRRTI